MRALVVTVDRAAAELAADALWGLGVVAVEERTSSDGELVELWTALGDDIAAVTEALSGFTWPWRFEHVDESVADTWREHAEPTWIEPDLVVHPSWRTYPSFGDAIAIAIDPGATFGMGDHPTTVLSLRLLRERIGAGMSVLDVGCGSGVLAIAACLFGAARAEAIDISPAAVPATSSNAGRNGVSDRVHVSTTPLADIDGTFDIVLANILAPVLIDLADDLRRVLRPTGTLIISGILAARHDHVLDALRPLRPVADLELNGWAAIALRGPDEDELSR